MVKNNNIILRKELSKKTYFYTVLLNYSIMWSTEHKFSFTEKSVWRSYTKDYVLILQLKWVVKTTKSIDVDKKNIYSSLLNTYLSQISLIVKIKL